MDKAIIPLSHPGHSLQALIRPTAAGPPPLVVATSIRLGLISLFLFNAFSSFSFLVSTNLNFLLFFGL